jgi:hypothetical protein
MAKTPLGKLKPRGDRHDRTAAGKREILDS